MHTSAKARLKSVAIRIRIRDPDRHQNTIVCSVAHCQSSLKISCKSVLKFLHKVADRQTDRQTDKQRRLHSLLGGGNKMRKSIIHALFPKIGQGPYSLTLKVGRLTVTAPSLRSFVRFELNYSSLVSNLTCVAVIVPEILLFIYYAKWQHI